MSKLLEKIKKKPHVAIFVPTALCFVQFITNFVSFIKDGFIDNNEFRQLLSTADGFETVILLIIMLALKKK